MILDKLLSFLSAMCILIVLCLAAFGAPATEDIPWPERLDSLEARTAVLMDGDTGQILFQKQENKKMHPASITKILTALIVVENTQPKEIMTTSYDAVQISADSTSIDLVPGEQLTVEEGLYALMVASANDAANVLAEHVGGSQKEFAKLMNNRLAEIGAVNTHFENPHGLTDKSHLTTAYDMALIMKEALKNPQFAKYFGSPTYTMDATNLNAEERELYNYHYMLQDELWAYTPEVVGGKVGFTNAAGNTLCTVAKRGDTNLIAVVLKSGGEGKFTDTQLLLDYGFDQFSPETIPTTDLESYTLPVLDRKGEIVKEAALVLPKEVNLLLPLGTDPSQVVSRLSTPDQLREENPAQAHLELYLLDTNEEFSEPLLRVPLAYDYIITAPLEDRESTSIPFLDLSWKGDYLVPALTIGVVLFLSGIVLVGAAHTRKPFRKKA